MNAEKIADLLDEVNVAVNRLETFSGILAGQSSVLSGIKEDLPPSVALSCIMTLVEHFTETKKSQTDLLLKMHSYLESNVSDTTALKTRVEELTAKLNEQLNLKENTDA